jgi:integrase
MPKLAWPQRLLWWDRQPIVPWTADEARSFLTAAHDDPLYPAFALLLLYGLRRGEVLGLRWIDVDLGGGEIRVRQQIGRVNGELRVGPVKTNAGRRDLQMLPPAVDVFGIRHEAQAADREELGRAWQDNGLVFTTRTGRPVEPRNFVRSFRRICAASGIRAIKLHHLRHTTATLLSARGVPLLTESNGTLMARRSWAGALTAAWLCQVHRHSAW